jgi:hypothetical protein
MSEQQQRHGLTDQVGEPTVMVTQQEDADDYGKEPELDPEVVEALEEATGDSEAVDILAGIVGDEFHIEMMSPWGDKWLWVGVDADKAQEIYKVLGTPVTFRRVDEGDGTGPRRHAEAETLVEES